jgi:hypothetical protein
VTPDAPWSAATADDEERSGRQAGIRPQVPFALLTETTQPFPTFPVAFYVVPAELATRLPADAG